MREFQTDDVEMDDKMIEIELQEETWPLAKDLSLEEAMGEQGSSSESPNLEINAFDEGEDLFSILMGDSEIEEKKRTADWQMILPLVESPPSDPARFFDAWELDFPEEIFGEDRRDVMEES